jgi:hypothetical protein
MIQFRKWFVSQYLWWTNKIINHLKGEYKPAFGFPAAFSGFASAFLKVTVVVEVFGFADLSFGEFRSFS